MRRSFATEKHIYGAQFHYTVIISYSDTVLVAVTIGYSDSIPVPKKTFLWMTRLTVWLEFILPKYHM